MYILILQRYGVVIVACCGEKFYLMAKMHRYKPLYQRIVFI